MTRLTDCFCHPGQESGWGQYTQESGDDGLSSNMKHKFSDNYDERALSVAAEAISFVRPIPKEELDIFNGPAMPGKVWSHVHATGPKTRPMSAEEVVIKPSTLAVNKKSCTQPHALSESSSEEETVMMLPGTAAITEGQADVEVVAEESCTEMATGEKPTRPKGPPLEGRTSHHCRKRTAGKYRKLYFLCWVAFTPILVSHGFPASAIDLSAADQKPKCFTCMDKDKCPKLMNIFQADENLYHRDLNDTFPECCAISPPGPKSCAVCSDQSNITIICSEDVGPKMDVEDSDGKVILNTSPVQCVQQQQQPHDCTRVGRRHVGFILSFALFLMVLGALLIYSRYQGKRKENGQQ